MTEHDDKIKLHDAIALFHHPIYILIKIENESSTDDTYMNYCTSHLPNWILSIPHNISAEIAGPQFGHPLRPRRPKSLPCFGRGLVHPEVRGLNFRAPRDTTRRSSGNIKEWVMKDVSSKIMV